MHKVALELGPFTIAWYGVFVALGFLFGIWTASRRALHANVKPELIIDLGPWLLVGAVIGARSLYVISYWKEVFAPQPIWEIFMVQHGGLVYYGGLIGSSLACILYARLKKLALWKLADILAPSIALGYVFGRFGCLMNGCCYGRFCSMPWAITYPVGHETHQVGEAAIPVHPSQVYDSILNLGLYALLEWFFRRKKFDGQIFAGYLIGYAILRFIVESFRGDYPVHYLGGWATPAQLISMGILVAGILLMAFLPRVKAVKMENKG